MVLFQYPDALLISNVASTSVGCLCISVTTLIGTLVTLASCMKLVGMS
jgi:hypothetical protein